MADYGFEFRSQLVGVTREEVWDRVSSWQGVNYELAPLVKMTHPRRFATVADVPADAESHFTAYLLLVGVLPVDAHCFALRALEVPHFFDERSSNLFMKSWQHRRSLTAIGDGVEVRDECRITPRLAGTGRLLERIYAAVFARRHQRLRAFYADRPGPRHTRE